MSSKHDKYSKALENLENIGANKYPNFVEFYGTCSLQREKVGLVMELFDNDLMEYITPPCSLTEAKSILRQIANGLRHLHKLKIVHRDVKPENILVKTDENGMLKVALTDLGVSKHMTATQRSNQTNIGTYLWMAPEVKGDRPKYGHLVDVFGFGLTAMFIVTGILPLGRDVQPDELRQWVDECLRVASLCGQDLSSLLQGCLEYDPARRSSMVDVVDHKWFLQDDEAKKAIKQV